MRRRRAGPASWTRSRPGALALAAAAMVLAVACGSADVGPAAAVRIAAAVEATPRPGRTIAISRTVAWSDVEFAGWRIRYPPNATIEPLFQAPGAARSGVPDGYRVVVDRVPTDRGVIRHEVVIGALGADCAVLAGAVARCVEAPYPVMYTASDRASMIELFDAMVAAAQRLPSDPGTSGTSGTPGAP